MDGRIDGVAEGAERGTGEVMGQPAATLSFAAFDSAERKSY